MRVLVLPFHYVLRPPPDAMSPARYEYQRTRDGYLISTDVDRLEISSK
jgi:hypothetical protein